MLAKQKNSILPPYLSTKEHSLVSLVNLSSAHFKQLFQRTLILMFGKMCNAPVMKNNFMVEHAWQESTCFGNDTSLLQKKNSANSKSKLYRRTRGLWSFTIFMRFHWFSIDHGHTLLSNHLAQISEIWSTAWNAEPKRGKIYTSIETHFRYQMI